VDRSVDGMKERRQIASYSAIKFEVVRETVYTALI
jgi:hypothetical protein